MLRVPCSSFAFVKSNEFLCICRLTLRQKFKFIVQSCLFFLIKWLMPQWFILVAFELKAGCMKQG